MHGKPDIGTKSAANDPRLFAIVHSYGRPDIALHLTAVRPAIALSREKLYVCLADVAAREIDGAVDISDPTRDYIPVSRNHRTCTLKFSRLSPFERELMVRRAAREKFGESSQDGMSVAIR